MQAIVDNQAQLLAVAPQPYRETRLRNAQEAGPRQRLTAGKFERIALGESPESTESSIRVARPEPRCQS